MKRLFVLLVSASALYAAPCVSGSLQSYIGLGATGCSLGSVDYTSFAIVPGQSFATAIDPTTVTVTPGGTQFNALLMLSLSQTANAGQLLELIFRAHASGMLTAASVSLNSPTVTGDGAATGVLDVCGGGNFPGNSPTGCPGVAKSAVASAIAGGPNQLTDRVTFVPPTFFDLFYDLTLDGGATGSAQISSATLGVEAVPEPSVTLLVVTGLGVIGLLRRRL